MTVAASLEGDERLRLFLALRLPDDIVATLVAWAARELRGAAGGRLVPAQNLHVTLAFLGARPAPELGAIVDALRRCTALAGPIELQLDRYREGRSVGMLALRDRSGEAVRLAACVHDRLEKLGVYRREARSWLPHVSVIRYRARPRLSPPLPDLGRVAPSEAAAYLSRLHPTGARYEVLQSFLLCQPKPLGG